jgi:hypothetical protein
MTAKQIAYDNECRERILQGVHKLAKAVRVTLGPTGRVVVLEKSFGAPTVTKDGVTVAKEIELGEPYENMGAQMVKEVASKSSKDAGDGTTTAPTRSSAASTWPSARSLMSSRRSPRRSRTPPRSLRSAPAPPTRTSRSARSSPRQWTRWARTA